MYHQDPRFEQWRKYFPNEMDFETAMAMRKELDDESDEEITFEDIVPQSRA